ncbi:hypothetical protein [Neoroseomonas eburnea]|nr:hypothetical protein [Neoroseomonas eburnea]
MSTALILFFGAPLLLLALATRRPAAVARLARGRDRAARPPRRG